MHARFRRLLATTVATLTLASTVQATDPPSPRSPTPAAAATPSGGSTTEPVRHGRSRYDWKWVVARFDRNGDGRVERQEFPGDQAVWSRLDRTGDDRFTAEDLDWSTGGVLASRRAATFALGKSADASGDGRISRDEWLALFEQAAGASGQLTDEDLERLVFRPGAVKAARERQNRDSIDELLREYRQNDSPAPDVEQLAPDFELESLDGVRRVRLSDYRGKRPVALVFGSFTCGNYRTHAGSIEALYARWKTHVDFLAVYVREAHPVGDRPATETNAKVGVLEKQPRTLEERRGTAQRCVASLKLTAPMVIDSIDNQAARRYAALPDRLYLIDREGRVAFQGGPGPFAYNPQELEQAILLMHAADDRSAAGER